jgi:transcription elongation GreA/GreB family factor
MKENLKTKQALYSKCLESIEIRFQTVQNTIQEIQESLLSETKSSAGDKHETGRAMLQLEREKAGNQLAEIQKIKEHFSKIDISKSSKIIHLGSVVYTNKANYFIAISAGILKVENESFFAISPNSPIGQLLLSKTIGDTIVFNNLEFKIINVI